MDNKEYLKALGASIRAHRRRAGFTQEELATKTGVSTQWISEIERGNGAPSMELVVNISVLVGSTVSEMTRLVGESSVDDDVLLDLMAHAQRLPQPVLLALRDFAAALDAANRMAGRS